VPAYEEVHLVPEIDQGCQALFATCAWEKMMKIRKQIFDYQYSEVLDLKTRELIRVGCAVAVGCPD
jgi:alkylhydroperoxidase/carboxymuconolactone decarboxylase family protein YurZ